MRNMSIIMFERIFLVSVSISMLFAFIGCGSQSPNIPEPPSNLWFSYGADDLEIILHWQQSASQGVDGYRIYFESELIGSVPLDSMTFTDSPEYLGAYSVTAYSNESESQRISSELPQVWYYTGVTLGARALCAYRFDENPPYIARRSIVVYYGYDIFYGDTSNQYLADSVDFYADTTLTLRSPQIIVQEGRWTRAFHTRFYRIASNVDTQVLDTFSTIPFYDDSLFSDSLTVQREDLVAIACFQDSEPSISVDKRYAVIYIAATNNTYPDESITFAYIAQSDENYRLVKTAR
ncbi:hypothetical protein J7L68_08580 [bacterium]|nr:hypothetical protein [bacterium]